MSRVIVTGATGLVGGYVSEFLTNKNYDVVRLSSTRSGDGYYKKDLLDPKSLENIDSADIVVHAAAIFPGQLYTDADCYVVNRQIDDNVIDFCLRRAVKKIIYISTIYLNDPGVIQPGTYYQSKFQTEKLLEGISCESCVLRISSPYGPRQRTRNVLSIFINNLIAGKDLTYYGSGTRTQDFIHGYDIARAVALCIESPNLPPKINLDIVSGAPISMSDLANLLKLLKPDSKSVVRSAGTPDPQEDFRANYSIENARSVLGWTPQVSLKDGLADWISNIAVS